jgi:hypothetical protein
MPRPITTTYRFHGLTGCVEQRRNQRTGFLVGVYNCHQAEMESDPATPWATVCEEHHAICCHTSLVMARSHAGDPEGWCEDCRKGFLFNRMRGGYVYIEQGDVIGLVPTREQASLLDRDSPIVEQGDPIAGHPRHEFIFVHASHDELEAQRARKIHDY